MGKLSDFNLMGSKLDENCNSKSAEDRIWVIIATSEGGPCVSVSRTRSKARESAKVWRGLGYKTSVFDTYMIT